VASGYSNHPQFIRYVARAHAESYGLENASTISKNQRSLMRFHTTSGPGILREMEITDLPSVLVIERQSQTYPWKSTDFISSIQARAHHVRVLVNEENLNDIFGYYIYSTASDEAELLNITIRSEIRNQGLGKQLLQYLCAQLDKNIGMVFLEVRESNAPAIALYCSAGFDEIGKYFNYYSSQGAKEDALILAKQLFDD
jgi:ribosomal-protein-alanine N-acetyltransferase